MSEKVIYKIQNKVNDKIYIGSTKDKESRWRVHKSTLKGDKHRSQYLQNAFNKYGADNFEFSVIEEVDKNSDLIQREQYYMDKLNPEYNIRPKADRLEMSKETKEKLSKAHKGREITWGDKISEANKGKEFSEERRAKMSKAHKNPSRETRKKISEAGKEREHSEKTKKKISENHADFSGENHPQAKLTKKKVKVIKHLLSGNPFSQRRIGKMFGVSRSMISKISRGKNWSHVKI